MLQIMRVKCNLIWFSVFCLLITKERRLTLQFEREKIVTFLTFSAKTLLNVCPWVKLQAFNYFNTVQAFTVLRINLSI